MRCGELVVALQAVRYHLDGDRLEAMVWLHVKPDGTWILDEEMIGGSGRVACGVVRYTDSNDTLRALAKSLIEGVS